MSNHSFADVKLRIGGRKGLMQKLGDASAQDHKWKSLPAGPFCGRKDKAGVYRSKKHGQDEFKCQHPECSTGGRAVTEVGYVGMRLGLSEDKPATGGASPAYEYLLKQAGLWDEPGSKLMPTARWAD